jgi:hypothetical protein
MPFDQNGRNGMKKRWSLGTGILAALTGAIAAAVLMGSTTPAVADINGCPNGGIGNPQTSNHVAASATVNGNTVTYSFSSIDANPVDGVPGLIEYCVYSDTQPDSVNTLAIGDNGGAWSDPAQFDNFSFQRPDGNPSNIGFDGGTDTIGDATWNGGVPANYDKILLHINDATECNRLYGGNPGTCFVLPGSPSNEAADLTASKDATASFDKTFTWGIQKDVDKTTVKQVGGSATFNYTITVTHDSGTPGNWQVGGTIKIDNPNSDAVTGVDLTDAVDNGGSCAVTNGTNVTVPGSGSASRSYSCTYSAAPSPSAGKNTVTASWSEQNLSPSGAHLAAGSATGTATFDFDTVSPNLIHDCVNVSDDNATPSNTSDDVALGKVCSADASPKTFTFSRSYTVPASDCRSYTNTATFTATDDNEYTGSDDATVTVCGPAKTGALTIGFWKTTNGQNLVKIYCQNPALANYLKGLGGGSGPFSNAPTTSCNDLASYVYSILNGASATDMNKMLKAQMLGTALDVWFSGSGWTQTKIGSIKPPSNFLSHNNLGTFKMDTTAVCPMVDNLSTGSATCKNNTPSTDAVAAGAVPSSPMAMQAILDFAATTPSPFNGSTSSSVWYAGNRTKQEILKNIFDQFNNQLAFGSF